MKYIKLLFLSLSFAATFTACDMTDFGDISTLEHNWRDGDVVELCMDMEVELVEADPRVKANDVFFTNMLL